ncbi:hypothetical protein FACS1894132_00430 [Clostridia bacterium]|nr:hypothetical protein FACS1894132_00430 [Clostridia bacterium]
MALTICGSFALPASAVPITIKVGDIDNDGMVGKIADVVLLGKHFTGQIISQTDMVDINHDGVATRDDLDMLISYLTSSISSFPDTNASGYRTITDMTAVQNGTRTYLKHNYANDTTTSYDLTPTAVGVPGWDGVSPDNTNGQSPPLTPLVNTRTPYTNSAIIEVYGSNLRGTAFIIGPQMVATNAHLAYNINNSAWLSNLRIVVNGVTYYVSEAHVPDEYVNPTTNYGLTYDYALLKINTSVNLATTYGSLSFGAVTDDKLNALSGLYGSSSATQYIFSAGYSSGALTSGWGNLFNPTDPYYVENPDNYLYYNNYTASGDSGSPVLFDLDGDHTTTSDRVVIGVNAGGSPSIGGGPRITAQLMKFYLNNSNF